MRIIFRATASSQLGSGHIMRCLALADELCKDGNNIIEFVTQKYPENLDNYIREKGFIVEEVPYAEITKQEGLLRCSTLPLVRD